MVWAEETCELIFGLGGSLSLSVCCVSLGIRAKELESMRSDDTVVGRGAES